MNIKYIYKYKKHFIYARYYMYVEFPSTALSRFITTHSNLSYLRLLKWWTIKLFLSCTSPQSNRNIPKTEKNPYLCVLVAPHTPALLLQCTQTLCGCHLWRSRTQARIPHGDVHLLCSLLCSLSFFLCQHFCSLDHHHFPGTGWQNDGGVQSGEKWGKGKW